MQRSQICCVSSCCPGLEAMAPNERAAATWGRFDLAQDEMKVQGVERVYGESRL